MDGFRISKLAVGLQLAPLERAVSFLAQLGIRETRPAVTAVSTSGTRSSGNTLSVVAASGGRAGASGAGSERLRALYDYTAAETDELTFREGDVIQLTDRNAVEGSADWARGLHEASGKVGLFPIAYTAALSRPSSSTGKMLTWWILI